MCIGLELVWRLEWGIEWAMCVCRGLEQVWSGLEGVLRRIGWVCRAG